MLEKLKDISKILLIPAAVLYFLGFISITSYLARFGIVNFDIINARFLIAGIYPLISLIAVFFSAWVLYENLPIGKIFDTHNWDKKFFSYFYYLITVSAFATFITLLCDLGKYRPPEEKSTVLFRPLLGSYDFIGDLISRIPNHMPVGYDFVFRAGLYIFSYAFLVVLVLILSFIFYDNLLKKVKDEDAGITIEGKKVPDGDDKITELEKNRYFILAVFLTDIFFLSFMTAIFIYSILKLGISIIDFKSFGYQFELKQSLFFAWIYTSSFFMYFFLNFNKSFIENIDFNILKKVNILDVQYGLQQFIIPILGAVFLFGITIFPRIPFAIGGGESREVVIKTSLSEDVFSNSKTFLIGESDQFLYVVVRPEEDGPRALQINKDIIQYIQTKKVTTLLEKVGEERILIFK